MACGYLAETEYRLPCEVSTIFFIFCAPVLIKAGSPQLTSVGCELSWHASKMERDILEKATRYFAKASN